MGLGPAVTWDSARCRLRTVQVEAPRGPEMEPEAASCHAVGFMVPLLCLFFSLPPDAPVMSSLLKGSEQGSGASFSKGLEL